MNLSVRFGPRFSKFWWSSPRLEIFSRSWSGPKIWNFSCFECGLRFQILVGPTRTVLVRSDIWFFSRSGPKFRILRPSGSCPMTGLRSNEHININLKSFVLVRGSLIQLLTLHKGCPAQKRLYILHWTNCSKGYFKDSISKIFISVQYKTKLLRYLIRN